MITIDPADLIAKGKIADETLDLQIRRKKGLCKQYRTLQGPHMSSLSCLINCRLLEGARFRMQNFKFEYSSNCKDHRNHDHTAFVCSRISIPEHYLNLISRCDQV